MANRKRAMDNINTMHKHWTVIAYDEVEHNQYKQSVTLELVGCMSEKDAIRVASKTVVRENYTLYGVRDCGLCAYQREAVKAMSRLADDITGKEDEN